MAGAHPKEKTMALLTQSPYKVKEWDLNNLVGISDHTLEIHFGLYAGYVKNTNLLNEQLVDMAKAGEAAGANPKYAEMSRRLGFEYNGMVLHEWYFDNLGKDVDGGANNINSSSELGRQLGEQWGDIETWRKDFMAVGGMRGVGWAVTYQDPANGKLSNHWITLHEDGNIAGFRPVIVMDVWEHAFLLDYKPAERPKYIESFMANLDIAKVEARVAGKELRPVG
jgi:Fe-Mn family superoxide dismutase